MQVPKLSSLSWDALDHLSPPQKNKLLFHFVKTRLDTIHRLIDICDGIDLSRYGAAKKALRQMQAEISQLKTICEERAPIHRFTLVYKERARSSTSDIEKRWKTFDGLTPSQKREFLDSRLQTREPIYSFCDMRKGDHLVRKISTKAGSLPFYHHFLCIGHNKKHQPVIIHYFVSVKWAFRRMFDTNQSLATVNIMTLPHADFIKCEEDLQKPGEEVERIVWPDALRSRYGVETVIQRALSREGEHRYELWENNCEHFVMWCICGFKVSLQVPSEYGREWEHVDVAFSVASFMILAPAIRIDNPIFWIFTLCLSLALNEASLKMFKSYNKWTKGVITLKDYIDKVSAILVISLSLTGGSIMGATICIKAINCDDLPNRSVVTLIAFQCSCLAGALSGLHLGSLTFRNNFFGLRHLTNRKVWKHSFLNVGPGCFRIIPPVKPLTRFVITPFVNSRVGFKLFSLGIKHGIITEILGSTLSPLEVFGVALFTFIF